MYIYQCVCVLVYLVRHTSGEIKYYEVYSSYVHMILIAQKCSFDRDGLCITSFWEESGFSYSCSFRHYQFYKLVTCNENLYSDDKKAFLT